MTEWRTATIEELTLRTSSGGTPSRKRPEFFADGQDGIPWVRSQELVDRRISSVGEHITDEGLAQSSAKLFPPSTVLVAMYGATVGQLGYLDIEAATNQAICALITDPDATDSRFLYFSLMGARHDLVSQAQGAAQQNLSQAQIRRFSLRVPDLPTQRTLAEVLGSIDDLIENNRRRIAVLEEMAQAVYREWFVHFRYPGHEDIRLIDSPLGPIPEGWEVTTLDGVTESISRGVAPKYSDEGEWLAINQRCIRDGRVSLALARPQSRAPKAPKQVRDGDVLVNSTGVGTLGHVAVYRGDRLDLTADSHVTIVRPSIAEAQPWFGLHMLDRQEDFERLGTGSTGQTELGRTVVAGLNVLVPTSDLRSQFQRVMQDLIDMVAPLRSASDRLAQMRDVLLPTLVTGEIDVSQLDLDALIGVS